MTDCNDSSNHRRHDHHHHHSSKNKLKLLRSHGFTMTSCLIAVSASVMSFGLGFFVGRKLASRSPTDTREPSDSETPRTTEPSHSDKDKKQNDKRR